MATARACRRVGGNGKGMWEGGWQRQGHVGGWVATAKSRGRVSGNGKGM